MRNYVTLPEGYEDETIPPLDARLHCRGAAGAAWRLAEASFKNRKSPNNEDKPSGLLDEPIDLDRGTRTLSRFQDVYGYAIQVADRPSDRTLSIAHHLWMKRSMEFAPLSSATAYSDQDSSWLMAPKKVDGADLLYNPGSPVKKSDMWMKSAPCFAHAVRILMYSYLLASVQDPEDQQWVNLSAALAWVGPIKI